jgi:HSP20 family protein
MSLFRGFQEITPLFRMLDDYAAASARHGFPSSVSSIRAFQPKFDVRELKDTYELHGELPGIAQKDISVEWEDGQTLTISGHTERHRETKPTDAEAEARSEAESEAAESSTSKYQATVEDSQEEPATTEVVHQPTQEVSTKPNQPKYWITERAVGEFRRSWTFPSRVDQENVKASLKDGILSIVVPKASPPQPKKITIE